MIVGKGHAHHHLSRDFGVDVRRVNADTRSKLLIVTLSVLTITQFQTLVPFFLFIPFFILILFSFRPRMKNVFKKVLPLLPLIVSVSLLSVMAHEARFIVKQGFFTTSWTNVTYGLYLGVRTLLIVILVLSLVESEASFHEIIYALEDLHVPKFFTSLMFFIFHYIEVLYRDVLVMKEAAANRSHGNTFGLNLYTYRTISYMIGGLLARSLVNARTIADVLIIKNFQGNFPHDPKPFQKKMLFQLFFLSVISSFLLLLISPWYFVILNVVGGS